MAQATLENPSLAAAGGRAGPGIPTAQPERWALLGRARRDRTVIAGALIVGVIAGAAIAAPFVAPHDPSAVDARAILAPPSGEHQH